MSFKSEFQNLLLTQPRYNLKQVSVENCDYADTAVKSKNCYYSFGTFYCEDVLYARYSRKCQNCVGLTFCVGCEWCNECTDCVNGYMLDFCRDCHNCSECTLCIDCYGCKNCFGCVGLYQKEYCLFNTQLTKEEYLRQKALLNLADPHQKKEIESKLEEVRKNAINLGIHQFQTEDCIGDHLSECKDCYQCYDSFTLEDCLYCIETNGNKSSCDLTVCFESEACYSAVHSPLNYNSNFLFQTDASSDSEFCAFSKNLKNCFGCVYLSNKQYYILNKPYSAEEYKVKVEQIRKELQENHEYNMLLYFASDYEKNRLLTETDSVIQSQIPLTSLT